MNQRKMPVERRIPRNHKVVRRLDFGEVHEAAIDNVKNQIKEQEEELRLKLTEKYNFDFKNEIALRGKYIWTKMSEDGWVPMEVKELEINANEMTPAHSRTTERPPSRRRRMPSDNAGILNSHVKKRLMMD